MASDVLSLAGEILSLAGLLYGAWLCLSGRFDEGSES